MVPDPTMSLVVVEDLQPDDDALRNGAEWCVRRYAEPASTVSPGDSIPLGRHAELQLQRPGRKSFVITIEKPTSIALFAQHTAEEFDLRLGVGDGADETVEPIAERTWVAQHEHDDEVGSVAIEVEGNVDGAALNEWLGTLLRERGVDIFRMKGFISIAGEPRRFVFQGVHMLFDGQPERPWGNEPRRNQLVFIGRKLERKRHETRVRSVPELSAREPMGVLCSGFRTSVNDYAIAGGWGLGGKVFVVGDAGGAVHAFESTSGKEAWENPKAHEGGVMDVAVSGDGSRLATVGQDGQLALWNVADGRLYRRLDVASSWVEHATWSPGGEHLAVSSGRVATIVSSYGERIWSSEDHPSTVSALGWVTDKELATACYGRVTFFDISSAQETQRLEWRGSLVSLALSRDGNIVACGSQDNTVHFWRRSSGEDSMMAGYPSKPSALAFSADGSLLATSGSDRITVWSFDGDGPEGTRPGVLELHAAPVSALTFSRRQRRLASGGRDSGVVVWDLQRAANGPAVGTALASGSVENVYWRPGRSRTRCNRRGGRRDSVASAVRGEEPEECPRAPSNP